LCEEGPNDVRLLAQSADGQMELQMQFLQIQARHVFGEKSQRSRRRKCRRSM
jgi:hypothetical protein